MNERHWIKSWNLDFKVSCPRRFARQPLFVGLMTDPRTAQGQ